MEARVSLAVFEPAREGDPCQPVGWGWGTAGGRSNCFQLPLESEASEGPSLVIWGENQKGLARSQPHPTHLQPSALVMAMEGPVSLSPSPSLPYTHTQKHSVCVPSLSPSHCPTPWGRDPQSFR